MEISSAEMNVLQHSLGGLKAYRNHFCTGEDTDDYPICSGLVEKGLMSVGRGGAMSGGSYVFRVTEKGKKIALAVDPAEYHTRCHDCGQFCKKRFWVPKNHHWKQHAVCGRCIANYDDPYDA